MTRQCESCGRTGPVELQMTVNSGQELTLLSCSGCEARTWLVDGQPVSKEEALRVTSGNPDFVVVPSVRKPKRSAPRR